MNKFASGNSISWRLAMAVVGMTFAVSGAKALPSISDISDPLQYNPSNYYAYAVFSTGVTWSNANALVLALPAYNGLAAHLATFPTDEQFTWLDVQEFTFTSPSVGDWDEGWIGAVNASGAVYSWTDGSGTIPTNSPRWDVTYNPPVAGKQGVSLGLAAYGDILQARDASDNGVGNAIVQYSPIPEPTVACVFALGGALMVALRRRRQA